MEERTALLYALGGLQTINLFVLGWIKLDIRDLWERHNTHGHKIECDAKDCKPKTKGVLVHE